MAFDGDPNLFGTIMGHIREIGGRKAELETWDCLLWEQVYDNNKAVAEGRGQLDPLVNITYVFNRMALADLQGNEDETRFLGELAQDLGAKYPITFKERRG